MSVFVFIWSETSFIRGWRKPGTHVHKTFALLSLVFSITAYLPLLWAYIRNPGHAPHKSSWVVFSLVDTIIFVAMLVQHQFAPQILAYVIGASSIMLVAVFWKGEPGWTREDKLVLIGAGTAMVLWKLLSANAAIAMSILAVSIGTIPIARALWEDPRSQPHSPWILFWLGGLCGVLSIEHWSFSAGLGPVGFFLQQTFIIALLMPRARPQPI